MQPPSDEVIARTARPEDAAAFVAIYAPFVRDTAVSFETEPPTVAEMQTRIEATLERTPWLTAISANDGEILGYAYASKHRDRAAYQWSVDVSAYVHERARHRGVGRKLYETLFAILANQRFHNAYAGIALPNPASVALHESVGFEFIGTYKNVGWKFRKWHDVAWYGKTLLQTDSTEPPIDPIPFAKLREMINE